MALFGDDRPRNLEQVLGRQAQTQSMGLENAYAKKRGRLVSQQAHLGRLGSGVSNYNLADLDAAEIGDLSGVQGGLAEVLGQVPAEDYGTLQAEKRKRELAILLAEQMQPSDLEEAFGAIGGVGNLAAMGAGIFG